MIAISYQDCSNRAKALPKTVSQRQPLESSNVSHCRSGCSRSASLKQWARLLTFNISASRYRGPRLTACSIFNLCFKYEACRKASLCGWKLLRDWTLLLSTLTTAVCLKQNQFVFKFYSVSPGHLQNDQFPSRGRFLKRLLAPRENIPIKNGCFAPFYLRFELAVSRGTFLPLSGWSCISENDRDSRAFSRSLHRLTIWQFNTSSSLHLLCALLSRPAYSFLGGNGVDALNRQASLWEDR